MSSQRAQDHRLQRLDGSRLILPNRYGIPVRVFANDAIPLESEAVDQLLDVLALQETIEAIQSAAPDFFGGAEPHIAAVSISPDFHRSSIPIGTTIATSGNDDALQTACHGAGRALSRGTAMRVDDAQLDTFLSNFRVVTPVDVRRPDVRGRRDILAKWRDTVKQEASWAYKDVAPVIEMLRGAEVAQPGAEFFPLLAVKG